MLADVIRARADFHSLDPSSGHVVRALEALADYVEAGVPGCSPELLRTLEMQARRYEAVFGFPDFGARASDYLEAPSVDHVEALARLAALALLDAYEELRENTLSLPRYALQDGLAVGYGLHPAEVEAAIDGVRLDERYFAGQRTPAEAAMARAAMLTPDESAATGSARRRPRRTGRRRG